LQVTFMQAKTIPNEMDCLEYVAQFALGRVWI